MSGQVNSGDHKETCEIIYVAVACCSWMSTNETGRTCPDFHGSLSVVSESSGEHCFGSAVKVNVVNPLGRSHSLYHLVSPCQPLEVTGVMAGSSRSPALLRTDAHWPEY